VENETVERLPRLSAADQVNDGLDASASAPAASADAHRLWRRQATILTALAIACVAVELPFSFIFNADHAPPMSRIWLVLALSAALASMVPLGLKLCPPIGFPGAPWIAARLAGEAPPFPLSSLIRNAALYAFGAAAMGAIVLAGVMLPMALLAHRGQMEMPQLPQFNTGAGGLALAGIPVAIAAGVSEEIEFRLALFAIFAAGVSLLESGKVGPPSRRGVWFATILQGYLFGMIHLLPNAGVLEGRPMMLIIGAILMPQTWEGVVFARLYLRKGLEAAIFAHAIMDFGLFIIAMIGMIGVHEALH
jgi:membrane protease YdiL (CAAX protease family)